MLDFFCLLAGTPTPSFTSLSSCTSAPITRQPSVLPPTPPSKLSPRLPSPSPRAADTRQHAPLQHPPVSPFRPAGAKSEIGVRLPELQQCPSVASAPCSSGLDRARKLTGEPEDSSKQASVPNSTAYHIANLADNLLSGAKLLPLPASINFVLWLFLRLLHALFAAFTSAKTPSETYIGRPAHH